MDGVCIARSSDYFQANFETKEKEIQQKIDELRESKTKLEHSERIKTDMIVSFYKPVI